MKNVTLSIPDDLLNKSRQYALEHNTSLNQMVRDYLSSRVMKDRKRGQESLFELMDSAEVKTNVIWTRDDLYKR